MRAVNNFAVMRANIISLRAIMLLFVFLPLTDRVNAQTKNGSPASKELDDRIASLDAALFAAYNTCDLDKVGTFFTEDIEFYHEKGGLTLTLKGSLDVMRKNLCGDRNNKVRRELIKSSLEVFPVNNYGAVQTGEHRFCLTQKGQKERLDGVGKFMMVWQNKDGAWKISRVVSYGFRPGE